MMKNHPQTQTNIILLAGFYKYNYSGLGSIPPGFFQMVDKWVMNAYIICSLYSWAIFSLKQCESPIMYAIICMADIL